MNYSGLLEAVIYSIPVIVIWAIVARMIWPPYKCNYNEWYCSNHGGCPKHRKREGGDR